MTQVSVRAATNKTLESDKGAFLKELEEKEPGKYKALELLVKDFSPGEITPVFSKSAPAPSGGPPDNIVYDFFFKSPQGLAMGIEDIASIAGIASDWLAMSTSQRYGAQGKKWKEEVNKKYTKPALDALKMLAPVVYEGYMGYQAPSVENVPARAEALRVGGALAEGMREEIGERGAFGVVHPAEIAAVPFVPKMSRAAKTVMRDIKAGVPESTGRSSGPSMVPQRPGSRAIVRGRPAGGGFDEPEGPKGPSEDIQELLSRSRQSREALDRRRGEVEEDNRSYEEAVGEAPPLGVSKEEWDKYVAKRDKWLKQKGEKDKKRLHAKHLAMVAAIGEHPGMTEVSLTAKDQLDKSFEYDRKAILWQIENGYLPESATPAYSTFDEYLAVDPLDITGIPKRDRAYKRLDSRELAFFERSFSDDFIQGSFKDMAPGISLYGQTLVYDNRSLSAIEDFLGNFEETFPGQHDPKPPKTLTDNFTKRTRSDAEEERVIAGVTEELSSAGGALPIGMATARPPSHPIHIDEYQGLHRRVFAGGGTQGGVRGVGGLSAPVGRRLTSEERDIGLEGIQGADRYNMGDPIVSQVQWDPDQLDVLTNYKVYHDDGHFMVSRGDFEDKWPDEDYDAYVAEYTRRKEAYEAQLEQVYQELDALKKANIESQQDPYNPVGRKLNDSRQNIRELFLIDYPDIGSYYGLTLENSFEVLANLTTPEAKTLNTYLKDSLNEISDPIRLQREWANPHSSSPELQSAFHTIKRNIEKYNETDPAKRKPLARDVLIRREDEDPIDPLGLAQSADDRWRGHTAWMYNVAGEEGLRLLGGAYQHRHQSDALVNEFVTILERMGRDWRVPPTDALARILHDPESLARANDWIGENTDLLTENDESLFDRVVGFFTSLPEGQVNISRPDSPARPSPALTNYRAARHDPNASVESIPYVELGPYDLGQIAEDQGLTWEGVVEALRAEDMLGFDNHREAANALLQHGDWEARWEVVNEENLAIFRDFTGGSERPSDLPDPDSYVQAQAEDAWEAGNDLSIIAELISDHSDRTREEVRETLENLSSANQERLIAAYETDPNPQGLNTLVSDMEGLEEMEYELRHDPHTQMESDLDAHYQEEARRTAGLVSEWMTVDEHVDLAAPTMTGADIHEFGRHYIERPPEDINWETPTLPQSEYVAFWELLPDVEDLDVVMTQWNDTALNNVVQYVSSFIDFPGVTDMAPDFPRDRMAFAKINQEFIKNNKNWDSKLLGADEEGFGLGFMDLSETWGEGAEKVRNREKAVAVINEWRKRQLGGNDF